MELGVTLKAVGGLAWLRNNKEGDTMIKLTPKQEKFIQNIVSGMTQRQAYKVAYQNNTTDKQADEEACKLFNSPKINQRYQELMKELEDEAIMTAKERMIWLTNVLKGEEYDTYMWDGEERVTTPSMMNKLKAMDILNKMSGEYVTKIDADVNNNNVNINIELSDD